MQRSPRLPEDGTPSLTGLLPEDAMSAKLGLTVCDSTRKPPALAMSSQAEIGGFRLRGNPHPLPR